ncbi:hypothetical protein H7097_03910 [Aeromicrobium sp.]|nr:hypothetical protein [Candidatus Saccharibacteria bacterium]
MIKSEHVVVPTIPAATHSIAEATKIAEHDGLLDVVVDNMNEQLKDAPVTLVRNDEVNPRDTHDREHTQAIITDRIIANRFSGPSIHRQAFIAGIGNIFHAEQLLSKRLGDERDLLEKPDLHFLNILSKITRQRIKR